MLRLLAAAHQDPLADSLVVHARLARAVQHAPLRREHNTTMSVPRTRCTGRYTQQISLLELVHSLVYCTYIYITLDFHNALQLSRALGA